MKIIDKLSEEVLINDYFLDLYHKSSLLSAYKQFGIDCPFFIDPKELKDIFRFADILSNSSNPNARNRAYQLMTFLNSNYSKDPAYRTIAKAIYSKLGNFPAINYLEKYNDNHASLPIIRQYELDAKAIIQKVPGKDNIVFTDSQFELYKSLNNSTEFSFSGPTSMGKSFIMKAFIRKIIKNKTEGNVVVIVPTRALINQFAIDLKNELHELLEDSKYRVATNSNIGDLVDEEPYSYIFVLTPERFISYMSQDSNPEVACLFIDEAHKIANVNDVRSVTTYNSIEKALKKYGNIDLYFASPNVSNPEVFLKLFNRGHNNSSRRTNETPVSQNLFHIDIQDNLIEYIRDNENIQLSADSYLKSIKSIEDVIHSLGKTKNNLVYCNSKRKTINYAISFAKSLPKISKGERSESLNRAIKIVEEYIHPDYYLANLLKHRVAYHYGKLPQLIRNTVEELYQNGDISTVFCTSTLLEGVNMPTQNIFILDNKNGQSKLTPIDFWNLSGRAGRLARELFGNIFCISHAGCTWDNKEVMQKRDIELKPTVLDRIDRNILRIEKVLKENSIKGTKEEIEILKYIANIICVDTLELKGNRKTSPLLQKLINNNKSKIIELAKNKTKDYKVPVSILNSNQAIDLNVQNKVFLLVKKNIEKGNQVKLPSVNKPKFYKACKIVLEVMHSLYEWDKDEKRLSSINSMSYFATIMTQWVKGFSLNQIIKESIEYHIKSNKKIVLNFDFKNPLQFNPNNKDHVNHVIENVIEDIENVLRFSLEKYFNHYHTILINLLGEENAGENWATLLEYGTQNRIVIALQNIGISRHTAIKVYEKCKNNGLQIRDNKLEKINKGIVFSKFKKSSMEYAELIKIL